MTDELEFVGDTLPTTNVGRPGTLASKVAAWVPALMAHPGEYAHVERVEKVLYGRGNSLRLIASARTEPGKFEVSVRRDATCVDAENKWDGTGDIYIRYLPPEMLANGSAPAVEAAPEPPEATAPEPVTV